MGIFGRYKGTASCHSANTVRNFSRNCNGIIRSELLLFDHIAFPNWIFVSFYFRVTFYHTEMAITDSTPKPISISGSSATIYVYVGEFMNNARRSKAIMGSSVIFGIICIAMPFLAWCIINQDWQFEVPFIVTYKPWRLFLAMCSVPEILSFLIITFLPESPKFVLSQGKPDEAYKILQKMNRLNNGRHTKLEAFEIYEDGETGEKHQKNGDTVKRKQLSLMESVSVQTIPLFQSPYLFRTVLICAIQFMVFFTCQGLNVFFTEISNRLAVNSNHTDRMMMCEILNLNKTHLTDIQGEEHVEVN